MTTSHITLDNAVTLKVDALTETPDGLTPISSVLIDVTGKIVVLNFSLLLPDGTVYSLNDNIGLRVNGSKI